MTPVRKNHRTLGYAAALAVVTAGLIAAPPQSARAQAQVPKTVRILVPFPAGGPTDTAARVISEQIGKLHGISFVIENRVGGGSAIASEAAARAAALQDANVRSKLVNAGLFPTGVCGTEFAAHLRQQHEHYVQAIREANIQAQ